MDEKRKTIVLLTLFLSRKKIYKLLQIDPTLKEIYSFTPIEIEHFLQVPPKKAHELYIALHKNTKELFIHRLFTNYIIITIYDETYPRYMKHIPDAPLVLYCLGDVSLLQRKQMISVVGTRKPTENAPQKLLKIAGPLISSGWTIVSGMAYGIDSLAHRLTLDMQGKTIAVLGSGFDHIYPKENMQLFNDIVANGLAITEYAPYMKPRKHQFPERNRIISGLSFGTLVIEAKEKSGTLITVDQALEQGKEVYAIPDSIFVEEAIGCLKLVDQGAKLVMNAIDIIETLPR